MDRAAEHLKPLATARSTWRCACCRDTCLHQGRACKACKCAQVLCRWCPAASSRQEPDLRPTAQDRTGQDIDTTDQPMAKPSKKAAGPSSTPLLLLRGQHPGSRVLPASASPVPFMRGRAHTSGDRRVHTACASAHSRHAVAARQCAQEVALCRSPPGCPNRLTLKAKKEILVYRG
jgi:hypothetical protein